MTVGDDDCPEVAGNLDKAKKELGADVADFEPGGGGSEGVRSLLQGGSPGVVAVQGKNVGHEPQDGVGPE